jgi:hypothetical protein
MTQKHHTEKQFIAVLKNGPELPMRQFDGPAFYRELVVLWWEVLGTLTGDEDVGAGVLSIP